MNRPEPTISPAPKDRPKDQGTEEIKQQSISAEKRPATASTERKPSSTRKDATVPQKIILAGVQLPFHQVLWLAIKLGFAAIPLIFMVALGVAGAKIFYRAFLAYFGVPA